MTLKSRIEKLELEKREDFFRRWDKVQKSTPLTIGDFVLSKAFERDIYRLSGRYQEDKFKTKEITEKEAISLVYNDSGNYGICLHQPRSTVKEKLQAKILKGKQEKQELGR